MTSTVTVKAESTDHHVEVTITHDSGQSNAIIVSSGDQRDFHLSDDVVLSAREIRRVRIDDDVLDSLGNDAAA